MENERRIATRIHEIIDYRLFGAGAQSWSDLEAYAAVEDEIDDLGRRQDVVPLALLMAFTGLWDPWEVPGILEGFELIDAAERDNIYGRFPSGDDDAPCDRVILPILRRVYFDHFGLAGRPN